PWAAGPQCVEPRPAEEVRLQHVPVRNLTRSTFATGAFCPTFESGPIPGYRDRYSALVVKHRMKRFRLPRPSFGTIGWILILGFLGFRIYPQLRAAAGIGSSGDEAPAYVLETLDGAWIDSESLRGKVVLVNFWATWCPPCRVEMPGFERVYNDRRDEGFVVLGLSTDRGSVRVVREF